MAIESSNPYSPPVDVFVANARTSTAAANVLVGVLLLVLSLRAFRAAIYLAVLTPWDVVRDAATWLTPDTLGVSWAATWPFLAMAVASFSVWIYRANGDARALGAEGLSFSPAWAVAVGFIPVVNLIGPYRAVKEIYQASSGTSGTAWMSQRAPLILPVWWGSWIASLAWSVVPFATLTASSAVWGQAIVEVLRAVAAALLIIVVRAVERRQAKGDAGL